MRRTGPRELRHMWRGAGWEEMFRVQIGRLLWSGKSLFYSSHFQVVDLSVFSMNIEILVAFCRCARSTTGFSIRNTAIDSRFDIFDVSRDAIGVKSYYWCVQLLFWNICFRRSTVEGRSTTRGSPTRMRSKKERKRRNWKKQMLRREIKRRGRRKLWHQNPAQRKIEWDTDLVKHTTN